VGSLLGEGEIGLIHFGSTSFAVDEARELHARGRAMLVDLALDVEGALVDIEGWRIEMLADDLDKPPAKVEDQAPWTGSDQKPAELQ